MNINFEKYSLEELKSSLSSVDKDKYPENYQRLLIAIEKRKSGVLPEPSMASSSSSTGKIVIRPFSKIGFILIILGIVNLFLGLSGFLISSMGSLIGGILDKSICAGMIFSGIWMLRKKMVVNGNSVRFHGLVDGNSNLEIISDQIKSVSFNHLKQKVEISTSERQFLLAIPQKSEAFENLSIMVNKKEPKLTA